MNCVCKSPSRKCWGYISIIVAAGQASIILKQMSRFRLLLFKSQEVIARTFPCIVAVRYIIDDRFFGRLKYLIRVVLIDIPLSVGILESGREMEIGRSSDIGMRSLMLWGCWIRVSVQFRVLHFDGFFLFRRFAECWLPGHCNRKSTNHCLSCIMSSNSTCFLPIAFPFYLVPCSLHPHFTLDRIILVPSDILINAIKFWFNGLIRIISSIIVKYYINSFTIK